MLNYELDTNLLALLPPWYREVLEYQEICNSEEEQFEALADSIRAVADNFFISTMDSASLAQWEQILQISADPETETLAFRRDRIINRISMRPPFTIWFLEKKLDELIGPGNWEMYIDYANYTLYVDSSAQNQSYAQEVSYTIGKIKPAHIVFVNRPFSADLLLLSEEITLASLRWNYKLGSWGLGLKPFQDAIDQGGVIKLATTPSIQPLLLTDTATYLSTAISKARVNGTSVVSDLTKSVSGGTLTVTYTAPISSGVITLVELLDSSNNVLTTASVYIPVTAETSIKHTIIAQEGVASNGN